jgi:anti-sigma factor RsiW
MNRTDPHHSHKNCLALFERLSEYIDKEVDTPTCKAIEAHIKACKPCQVCLETLKQTVDLCKNLERSQVPETLSLKLKESIYALINKPTD